MSTSEDASASSGSLRPDETATTQPVLPTFASVRDSFDRRASQAESSNSSSRMSPTEFQRRSRSNLRQSLSFENSEGSEGSEGHDISPDQPRRKQNRSSGGFLLEPATKPSVFSRSLFLRSQHDRKGKRKSNGSELSIPKRRSKANASDQRISLGSSPLSAEVKPDGASFEERGQAQQNDLETAGGHGLNNQTLAMDGTPQSQRSQTPLVGFDTDPAQIVDMALRLSEGRRRHLSSQRHISGDATGRRVVSLASPLQRGGQKPSRSLGHHLNSPPAVPITPTKGFTPERKPDESLENGVSSSSPPDHPQDLEPMLEISRATAIRVEKAKSYLELAYEFRRLLSHLPPIRHPDIPSSPSSNLPESRVYNPLQYARNRKLRLREKSAINTEAEGWHDVEKVRNWVDTVIRSHTETRHDPVECVRLPPLSHQDTETAENDKSPNQTGQQLRQQPARPKRPKSDWVTHPGNLIADAHWLEQGLNKTKIQDRDNNPIYPSHTQFRFSGWRNVTPVKATDVVQEPTPPPEDQDLVLTESPLLETPPALPNFKSARERSKDHKRKSKIRKNILSKAAQGEPKKRSRGLFDGNASLSDTASSTSESDNQKQRRGRKRPGVFDLPNGDPFDRPIKSLSITRDSDLPASFSEPNLPDPKMPRPSIEQHKLIKYLKRNSFRRDSQSDGERTGPSYARGSQHDLTDTEHGRRSSYEYDTTAPTSPAHEVFPSIAINLSPPPSRSPSPTKKGKSLLHAVLDRHHSQDREKIERNDFALPRSKSHSREASTDSNQHSRGTSPFSRSQTTLVKQVPDPTPQDEPAPNYLEHRASTLSRMSTRSGAQSGEHSSRIRGIFKGGRIAELVGNEVNRVGDFIWKRDLPPSETSNRSFDGSMTDEDVVPNGFPYKRAQHNRNISTSTKQSKDERRSMESSDNETSPQYHNPNLPSFTSPFQKDREKVDKRREDVIPEVASPPAEDHISRQAADVRSRGKSPRLDLLSPPRLDTSAHHSPDEDWRRGSYGFGAAMHLAQSRNASHAYNNAINRDSAIGGSRTGSTSDTSRVRNSLAQIGGPDHPRFVRRQDVARIEALLMMSAVKAKGLVAVQQQIPPSPSKFLADTLTADRKASLATQPLQVRRREEHIHAARNLIYVISDQSNQFKNQLHVFSSETVTQLHSEIQVLEDTIENTLTPQVRTAADNAGELSMKLTTTSTLAVKALNDTISEAFRMRKRGPFRWMRALGFKAIEWTVVTVLWMIWAVVTVIRFFTTIIRCIVWCGKWMVWVV